MGVLSWFSRASPPDYETLLSRLATDINDAKIHLSEIRLRERRISLLVYAYGIGLWAVWVGLWWVGGLPWGLVGIDPRSVEARIIGAASVSGGPVFIWLLSRLLHIFFTRQRNAEETHLRRLLAEQRKHLDAVKKATNYDSTRKLIEQYEGGSAPGTPLGPGVPPGSGPSTPQRGPHTPQTPQQGSPAKGQTPQQQPTAPNGTPRVPGHLVGIGGTPLPAGISAEQAAAIHMQMSAAQPVLPTPEKKWYDRVVDSILGDDPSQAPQSKYALVCGECFQHNGLVGSKYEWERMQWICPRCNHMNPPPISRQLGPSGLETKSVQQGNTASPSPVTPTPPAAVSPSPLMRRNAPVTRRSAAERGTPRSSKLGKEVFTASESDHDDDVMDVDETIET